MFVAHNGNTFDVLFLLNSLAQYNLYSLWEEDALFGYSLDMVQIVRAVYSGNTTHNSQPIDNKLSTLYQFFTGIQLEDNHCTMEDVKTL